MEYEPITPRSHEPGAPTGRLGQGARSVNTMPPLARVAAMLLTAALAGSALAQDRPDPQAPPPPATDPDKGRPEPVEPPAGERDEAAPEGTDEAAAPAVEEVDQIDVLEIVMPQTNDNGRARADRRSVPTGDVKLGLKDVSVKDLYEWIATQTGKAVMPINATQIQSKKFTIIMDDFVPRDEALDMLFSYLRLNGVGIIERSDIILIGDMANMENQLGEMEVVKADESVMGRIDRGNLILKIFQVEQANADDILNNIQEFMPDYGKYSVDGLSNQIMVLGDVGLCQQFESIIKQLDQKWVNQRMHTFRLKWADAGEIADNVWDLFEDSGGSGSTSARPAGSGNRGAQNRTTARRPTAGGSGEVEFRVTVNVQQNTLTIQSEPDVMEEIALLIATEWDLPRPDGTSRLFFLKYTDPLKVQSLLEEVLGTGTSSTASAGRRPGGAQGSAQRGDATSGISGVYRIDAYEDKNALLVLARTVESFGFIESIIEDIDQPSTVGLPEIISLKYADAVELSEEINVLLARAGARVTLPRPDTGLTAQGFTDAEGGSGVEGPSSEGGSAGDLQFPWQSGGNEDEQSPESALIGKVRVVPIIRQNALAVMSPPAYQEAIRNLIMGLDQPRRQVQIAATIVEIDITDDLALGIKIGEGWANEGPFIGGTADFTATVTGFLSNLIGSGAAATDSTLNLGPYSVGVIVEALATLTNARIIQEPRVFTADNEEAVFFSGKEYPIASSQTDAASGGLNTLTNINYRNVGVFLNVRPRITEEGAVDLEVSLELSDVGPNVPVGTTSTAEFNRKQVNSHVILLDGQTLVVGGLLREAERITKFAIPFLSEIPLIGPLFTFTHEELERKELIAFITPTVVHRPEDNYSNFNVEDLERLESMARPLADQLSDGERVINLDVYNRIDSHVKRNKKDINQPRELQQRLPQGSLDDAPIQLDIDKFQPELLPFPGEKEDENDDKKEDKP